MNFKIKGLLNFTYLFSGLTKTNIFKITVNKNLFSLLIILQIIQISALNMIKFLFCIHRLYFSRN